MRVVTYSSSALSENFIKSGDENDGTISAEERRLLTQLTVARYVVLLIVALVAASVLLIQLDMFRAVGVALLTSAGAAAVILGIAGHAVLGNLIAGLQIALTRPFRIGDTVMIEGNWGVIEDISYTYVVERTWDDRRLIIPIKYFINESFDNWSKTDEYLTKPIYLNVDYRANIQRIREKFFELLEADEEWDPDIDDPKVLAYECGDETMTVRLTCGAKDSSTIWNLHCRMREQIVAWLQGVEGGAWLPRQRVMLDPSEGDQSRERDGNGRLRSRSPAHARSGQTEGGVDGGDSGDDGD
jgi:small-conductance mechanosensitive channel